MTFLAKPQLANIDAEEAIIGGILLDAGALDRIVDVLNFDDFYVEAHQVIYKACQHLYAEDTPSDLMQVSSYLTDHNYIDDIGGLPKLAELLSKTVSAVNIDLYAALVKDKAVRRQLEYIGYKIVEMASDTGRELQDILENVEDEILSFSQGDADQDFTPMSDAVITIMEKIDAASELEDGESLTTDTGFYDLDDLLGGMMPGDLGCIAARTSMGKTSLGVQIGVNVAKTGKSVAIFSLEQSTEQISERIIAGEANINGSALRTCKLAADELDAIANVLGDVSALPIYINDDGNIKCHEIKSKCRRLLKRAQMDNGDLGLILVDYIQLMEGVGKEGNRVQELDKICRQLKSLAKKLKCPVIILSQVNRSVEQRTNKRPTKSDVRDSGAIEQILDYLMTIYRDEYYDAHTASPGIAEICVAKNRNGPTGTVELIFKAESTKFLNKAV